MEVAHRIHQIATERYGLSASRSHLRRPHLPAVHRRRRSARATPWTRSRPSGASRPRSPAPTPSSACPTSPSACRRRPATSSTRVFLHECVEAGLDAAIVHAARIMPLNRIPDEQLEVAPRPRSTTAAAPDYDPLATAPRRVRRREARHDREGGPQRLAGGGAPEGAHHRRRPRRPRGRPRRRPGRRLDAARPRQRRAARRHAHRGRAVRLGPDAAAVRAAVGRDDEGRRRPPRAAHGAGRRARRRRAASCWPR